MATTRPMGCTSVHHYPATCFYPAYHVVEFVLGGMDMRAVVPEDRTAPLVAESLDGASRIRSPAQAAPMLRQWIAEFTEKGLATSD